jgi:hypothetical protein
LLCFTDFFQGTSHTGGLKKFAEFDGVIGRSVEVLLPLRRAFCTHSRHFSVAQDQFHCFSTCAASVSCELPHCGAVEPDISHESQASALLSVSWHINSLAELRAA